jgi:hypothetical protein
MTSKCPKLVRKRLARKGLRMQGYHQGPEGL